MADSSSKTQLLIAVIGLTGVLGTALIANWDKIFPKPNPTIVDKQPVGSPSPNADSHKKKPVVPLSPKPETSSKPKVFSIDGRMTDQATGRVLCTGTVSAQIADVHQVQRPDVEGRYAFEFEGFAPEDELILDARALDHQELHLSWKLSQLDHLQNLVFVRSASSGAAVGAKIGALAGGGKGALIGSLAGSKTPPAPACADASGPLPAYQARPDASRLTKK